MYFRLTEMLLKEFPVLRQDEAMMRAYSFVIDFLDVVSKETKSNMERHQASMRIILEVTLNIYLDFYCKYQYKHFWLEKAAKISEQKVDEAIKSIRDRVTKYYLNLI